MPLSEALAALELEGHPVSMAKKVNGEFKFATFTDHASAEEWVEGDCYLAGNPMRPGTCGKPTEADVAAMNVLLVDVDPKKDDADPAGVSQPRRDAAWNTASAVWDHFDQKGVLVDSGRGAQVWLRVQFGVDRRALLSWIREEFAHPLIEIDATHDASRLMRCPGSVNSRTGDPVFIVSPGTKEQISRAEVQDLLASWAPPTQFDIPEADRSEPTRQEVRRYVTGRALEIWNEDPMEVTIDRSRRDFLFLLGVVERKAPLATASRLLHALPGCKAAERGDESYWVSTATAVLQTLDDERQEKDILANVVARAEGDAEYLFKKETLRVLAKSYISDAAGWVKLRGELKPILRGQGVPIGDFDKVVKQRAKELEKGEKVEPPDHALIYVRGELAGKGAWKAKDARGGWSTVSVTEARIALVNEADPDRAFNAALNNPFSITVAPFERRILPGRVWNESNARFVVDQVEGAHPMWDQLYTVVGRGLDNDVRNDPWCRENGITDGRGYLLAWTASMLQDPKSRRAYLFLFSPEQGTGKSLFFEAHRHLIGSAVCKANNALTADRFNGELAGAVLCYTEEVDLGKNGRVALYNRVKDWTLGVTLSVEAKGQPVFEVPNATSWGQAANHVSYCPVYKGDDRITMFRVLKPEEHERMKKMDMVDQLREQAPAFLHTLMNLELPRGKGRYAVPPIWTEVKSLQESANRNDLEDWLALHPGWILTTREETVSAFRAWLELKNLPLRFWSPQRIRRELPFEDARAQDLWQRLKNELVEDMTATEIKEQFGLVDAVRQVGVSLSKLAKVDSARVTSRRVQGSKRWTVKS